MKYNTTDHNGVVWCDPIEKRIYEYDETTEVFGSEGDYEEGINGHDCPTSWIEY